MHVYHPSLPLSRFINAFWIQENYVQPHPEERLLPTGTVEVVFDLSGDGMLIRSAGRATGFERFHTAVVCGPHSGFFAIDTAESGTALGIHFRPGGTYPFFGPPAHELRNAIVPLDVLLGSDTASFRDRLAEAPTTDERFAILERVLMGLAIRNFERRPAVAHALGRFRDVREAPSIARVARETGISHRRFIQIFNEEVGLTPKVFCRIRRFQEVVQRIESQQHVTWTQVAYTCGYYDQAHFIHDFREFSGFNPTEYFERRGARLNHVPVSPL